jgi:hypothetical protein
MALAVLAELRYGASKASWGELRRRAPERDWLASSSYSTTTD